MKRFASILSVAFAVLISAHLVEAQRRGGGGAGAINKLSGPGPFDAVELSTRFGLSFNGIYEWEGDRQSMTAHEFLAATPVWFVFGFTYAESQKNGLDYPAGFSEDTKVKFASFAAALDFRLGKSIPVEIGGGLAFSRFTGDAYDPFWSVSIGPRIGWRFLEPVNGSGGWRTFWDGWRLQFNVMIDPRGFKAEDFGAIPGTFDSGVDAIPQLIVSWDFNY
jgi:hypothetical protein